MDNITTAFNLVKWAPQLGIELPKELADILNVLEASKYVEYNLTVVDPKKVTIKNVQDIIADRSIEYATLDQFGKAKSEVQQRLAHAAVIIAGEVAPKVRDEILPRFQNEVTKFVVAVETLGDDLDPNILVRSGADRVHAFNTAVDCSDNIMAVESWLTSLTNVYRYAAFGYAPAPLRVTRPATRGHYQEIINAVSPTESIPGHLWFAAKNGVEIFPNLPDESKLLEQELNAMDVESRPILVSLR